MTKSIWVQVGTSYVRQDLIESVSDLDFGFNEEGVTTLAVKTQSGATYTEEDAKAADFIEQKL